jgi:hypothetical protein
VDELENSIPDFEKFDVNIETADFPQVLLDIDHLSNLIGKKLNLWLKISTSSVRTYKAT